MPAKPTCSDCEKWVPDTFDIYGWCPDLSMCTLGKADACQKHFVPKRDD